MEKFEAILALFDGRAVTIVSTHRPYTAKLIKRNGWAIRHGSDTMHLDLQNITDLYINANQRLAIRIKRELS